MENKPVWGDAFFQFMCSNDLPPPDETTTAPPIEAQISTEGAKSFLERCFLVDSPKPPKPKGGSSTK